MSNVARQPKHTVVVFLFLISYFLFLPLRTYAATDATAAVDSLKQNQEEITAKEAEIAELEAEIKELRGQRDSTAAEADIIESQLNRLDARLAKAQLELSQTKLALGKVADEKAATTETMESIEQAVVVKRQHMREFIRRLHEAEQQDSFLRVLFSSGSISEAWAQRNAYLELEAGVIQAAQELKQELETLQAEQTKLEQQEQDLQQLAALQASQQTEISAQKKEKDQFLAAKQQEQIEYEYLIAEAKQARDEIEQNLYSLKEAGVEVTLTQATDMAKLAGQLTGVRPALLMAVLKVETNVGESIGTGTFPDDMHPGSREAFLRITGKLGLDPYKAPIAARPKSLKGWGGAIGPGQFMPATWEGIEGRVASLLKKNVADPYELQDAFVATAIFLADRGATNLANEREAVLRYVAGLNWEYHDWYWVRVRDVAKEYEGVI